MRITIAILIFTFSTSLHALGWGSFSGHNEQKSLVTLSPDYNENSLKEKDVEDVHSLVYIGTAKSKYEVEIKEICHRSTKSTQNRPDIWCDGNKSSPLYGVTYRWEKTIKGRIGEDYSDKEIWLCVAGCNPRAPKKMLYEH